MERRRTYNSDNKTLLTSEQVAEAAGVPLWREYQVEIGVPVPPEDAQKVVAAFSKLTKQVCTVEDVSVRMLKTTEKRNKL
jgi:hypothetical protein